MIFIVKIYGEDMKWISVKDKLPPHRERVLTYSPLYHGARKWLEEGVVILSYDATPGNENDDYPGNRGWVTDDGEAAMFIPTYWFPLPTPEF